MKMQETATETQAMTQKQAQALHAVEALERAAKIEILVAGEDGKPFCGELREMAVAFRQHYDLDEDVMAKYDTAIQAAETSDSVPDAVLSGEDIVSLLEVTIDFCDSLNSTTEIMRWVKLMCDVMYLWVALGDRSRNTNYLSFLL